MLLRIMLLILILVLIATLFGCEVQDIQSMQNFEPQTNVGVMLEEKVVGECVDYTKSTNWAELNKIERTRLAVKMAWNCQ